MFYRRVRLYPYISLVGGRLMGLTIPGDDSSSERMSLGRMLDLRGGPMLRRGRPLEGSGIELVIVFRLMNVKSSAPATLRRGFDVAGVGVIS